jgi:uncharacterized membrane protein
MDIDLKLIIVLAILALISIYLPQVEGTAIRTILALLVIVVAPGYALVAALFPGKVDINNAERMVLSLGMSVILAALFGLGLNFTAWGISLDPVAISLCFFSVAIALVANMRRLELPESDRFTLRLIRTVSALKGEAFPEGSKFLDNAATVVLLLCIALSVSTIAYVIIFPQYGEKYTELYILGPNGIAENYTTNYHLGDNGTFIIGVVNHEQRSMSYNVQVVLNNSVNESTLYTDQFTLADNQTLQKSALITPNVIGTNMELQFLLYANGNMSSPYRECHVWINVTQPANTSL